MAYIQTHTITDLAVGAWQLNQIERHTFTHTHASIPAFLSLWGTFRNLIHHRKPLTLHKPSSDLNLGTVRGSPKARPLTQI